MCQQDDEFYIIRYFKVCTQTNNSFWFMQFLFYHYLSLQAREMSLGIWKYLFIFVSMHHLFILRQLCVVIRCEKSQSSTCSLVKQFEMKTLGQCRANILISDKRVLNDFARYFKVKTDLHCCIVQNNVVNFCLNFVLMMLKEIIFYIRNCQGKKNLMIDKIYII